MKVAFLMVNSSSAAVHNNRTDHHYHHQTSEVATTSSFSFMATGNSGITSTAAVRQHNL